MHRSRLCQLVIDVADLDEGVSFWSAVLAATEEPLTVASGSVYRQLRLPDSPLRVLLQKTGDAKSGKERMHLDLETDDVAAEVARVVALGATRWDRPQERDFEFWVLRDPWDNEFCVLPPQFPSLLAERPPWERPVVVAAQLADDPFGGRTPTSHERMTGQPWEASYQDGPAPWDTGHPQPAVVRVAAGGGFSGAVLDAGCGTGENALYLAGLGLPVLGFDVAQTALASARAKAAGRELDAEFVAADAFALGRLGRRFDTVLDSGLFHTFDAEERPRYVASLAAATQHGGTLYVLCFSDAGPDTGPHPVSQQDLKAVFHPSSGWNIVTIEPDRVQTRFHDENGAPAWLVTMQRV